MKRLFVAIKVKPEQSTINVFKSLRKSLYAQNIRWVDPENFHITLKFLGDTYVEDIPIVSNVIANTVATKSSFDIELANTSIFGSIYKPRLIWFGCSNCQQLNVLADDLFCNLDDIGFSRDRQNFIPHLTIGRISLLRDKNVLNEQIANYKNVELQKIKIDKLYLLESILNKGGSNYEIINTYKLK